MFCSKVGIDITFFLEEIIPYEREIKLNRYLLTYPYLGFLMKYQTFLLF